MGTRSLRYLLKRHSESLSRRRISRLMKLANLSCQHKRKFKVTTDSKHGLHVAPNLLARQFHVAAPNRYWVGDITYVPTQEGWLYLATVMDLYSRQIVGWSMADHMRAELVNNALTMALWRRKPGKGLIWHSDQGSQYCAASHRTILKDHGIIQSMSRKGNCCDNAVAESFFHTIKTELIHTKIFKTKQEAKHAIFEYIEVFYNRIRIHSANQYLSPVEFENSQLKLREASVH